MIRDIEERSINALPALRTVFYDGWVLRFSKGGMRRANSVMPLYESTLPLDEKIDHCERLYAEAGIKLTFKMTNAAQPAGLAEALAQRGYFEADGRTSVQTCELVEQLARTALEVEINPTASSGWLADDAEFNGGGRDRHIETKSIFENLVPYPAFVRLLDRNYHTAALGLAVLERGWIGIYNIAVAPEMRQRGLGRILTQTLINWGVDAGAKYGYLQVMLNNPNAMHLYTQLGFQEAYQYWYLQK